MSKKKKNHDFKRTFFAIILSVSFWKTLSRIRDFCPAQWTTRNDLLYGGKNIFSPFGWPKKIATRRATYIKGLGRNQKKSRFNPFQIYLVRGKKRSFFFFFFFQLLIEDQNHSSKWHLTNNLEGEIDPVRSPTLSSLSSFSPPPPISFSIHHQERRIFRESFRRNLGEKEVSFTRAVPGLPSLFLNVISITLRIEVYECARKCPRLLLLFWRNSFNPHKTVMCPFETARKYR